MIGGQTKTPTMSVLFEKKAPISSAELDIVAEHMKAAGAEVIFSTILGDDRIQELRAESPEKSGRRMPRRNRLRLGRPSTRMRSSRVAIGF